MFATHLAWGEAIKTGFSHESVCKQEVFASKKHIPIGGKQPHTSQSQNYMANLVIWLLRNRWKLWEGRRQNSDGDSDSDRDSNRDGEF